MEYRKLGKTGLDVSVIGIGTAELGMDYGIPVPGAYGKPDKKDAEEIINKAIDSGINLFDTAPSYGSSEELLGSLLTSKDCYIATKVNVPDRSKEMFISVEASVKNSLKRLRRDCLDIIQIHNATADIIKNTQMPQALLKLKEKGLIRFIGASVYEPADASAAVESGIFDLLQVAYNILDQRMSESIFTKAEESAMGVLGRSAYLKGVLTEKSSYLSQEHRFLKDAAAGIIDKARLKGPSELANYALRFCLSCQNIDSVLIGVRAAEELEFALGCEKEARLPKEITHSLKGVSIKDVSWLNPSSWPVFSYESTI